MVRSWIDRCRCPCVWTGTVGLLAACGSGADAPRAGVAARDSVDNTVATVVMNRVSETYVHLVLSLGEHDPDYVDAYYGPPEARETARDERMPLNEIRQEAERAVVDLAGEGRPTSDTLLGLRHQYLTRQLESLVARTNMLAGERLSFDAESQALYDAVAPTNDEAHFQAILAELDALVPGTGAVPQRFEDFRRAFVIPPDRVDAVFRAAIDACRARTAAYVELPEGERFELEYVRNKSWSGYNWYQGNYHSLIQVNIDLPIFIDRALDLACHEGYPGHHVYNVLLEQHLTRARGWGEFTVYPLFSPQSLIAEGSANLGIEMAFPGGARVAFERDSLFPLAGLDGSRAEEYRRVLALADRLAYAGNEAARRYLNGVFTRQEAADWLNRYALMAPARAAQRVDFIDTYRSYVINYNLGQDLVREYVNRGLAADAPAADRWVRFADLLASPRLPSGLR